METALIVVAAWVVVSMVIAVAWIRFFSSLSCSAEQAAEEAEAMEGQPAPRPDRLHGARAGWGHRAIRALVQRFGVGHPR